ncbi:MAG: peptidoglycan DD-metalloendopeptidase family protein [Spirochaetales bacterium]|nr:peptidoglycan DD-metalloendopeptidase family protein [Spirochaetales bacterium]
MRILLITVFLAITVFGIVAESKTEYYNQYTTAIGSENWVKAELVMRTALIEYPHEIGYVTNLTYSVRKQQRFSDAVKIIEPYFLKNPAETRLKDNYVYALIDAGWEFYRKKEYTIAENYFSLAHRTDPKNEWSVNAYGYILSHTGEKEKSIAVLTKAIKDFPSNTTIKGNLNAVILSLGWDYFNAKEYNRALPLFEEAFDLAPDDQWAINAYGAVLRETGLITDSIVVLENGYNKYPKNDFIKGNLIWAYILHANNIKDGAIGQQQTNKKTTSKLFDQAKTYYLKAQKINPDHEGVLLNYGVFLSVTGQYDEAITFLEKGEKLYPENDYFIGNIQFAWQEKIHALAEEKKYDQAITFLLKARKRFPLEGWFLAECIDFSWEQKKYADSASYIVEFAQLASPQEYRKPFPLSKEDVLMFRSSRLVWKLAELNQWDTANRFLGNLEKAMPGAYFVTELKGILSFTHGEKKEGIALVNKAYEQYIAAHPESRLSVTIPLPLRGTFRVGGNNSNEAVTHAGLNRYCFDFMGSSENGTVIKPGITWPGKSNEDYYGFGADIYSPVDGIVEDVSDSYADRVPSASAVLGDGNAIFIVDSNGYHYVFAHNKKGSAKVVKGQAVRAGEVIAQMGNTGYSGIPHLHFGVYTPDWKASIEIRFKEYTLITPNGKQEKKTNSIPQTDEVIRN